MGGSGSGLRRVVVRRRRDPLDYQSLNVFILIWPVWRIRHRMVIVS